MEISNKKFMPEKVLDIKEQEGEVFLLVKWDEYPIQKATWEMKQKLESFPQINQLIEQYRKSRAMDKKLNFHVKNIQKTEPGENPYFETSRHGHFLYGDQVDCIESIKLYEIGSANQKATTAVCEVKWKHRLEENYENQEKQLVKTFVILENTFMDTKTFAQYRPDLLAKFYQSKLSLKIVQEYQNTSNA